jgi:hypothetical protein
MHGSLWFDLGTCAMLYELTVRAIASTKFGTTKSWCPTTRGNIKIIKQKIHASPSLFSMQISHIKQ